MKLGLLTWLKSRISSGEITMTAADNVEFFSLVADACFRELAFRSGINMIANAVSKCEFKTYLKGKEVKDREYYLFNVEPNINQNSSSFIHKWIAQLYEKNECLIIENNKQLLVADDFQKTPYTLYDWKFTGVTVDDFTFNRTFTMSEVMYFQLNNKDIRRVINAMFESYGKMLAYGMKSYQKSKGSRGILDISTNAAGNPKFKETFDTLMQERFKNYFNAENAVLPLFDGYTYTEQDKKTYTGDNTRDIRGMVDDIFDFTARALCIPPVLMRGDMADVKGAVDNFLTFCIDPLCDNLQEEVNRKRNGYIGYSSGTYLQIMTNCIKHVDLLSVATAIDKLIASSAFCVNDIRKACGETIIDEPWAWQHRITKNYTSVTEANIAPEGGETK